MAKPGPIGADYTGYCIRTSENSPSTHSGEYQPTTAKGPAFPVPEYVASEKNPNPPRALLEGGSWRRGAEDSDFSLGLLLHIMASVYVSCSTQCPETPTWRD